MATEDRRPLELVSAVVCVSDKGNAYEVIATRWEIGRWAA